MTNTMRTRSSRQRGAAAAEYLGVITVVAALIAAVALGAPGIGTKVSGEIQAAICRIFGESCPAQDPFKPTGPCLTATSDKSASGGLTVFSVRVGGNLAYSRAKRSDGKVLITLKGGANAGGDFNLLPGVEGGVQGGPLKIREGESASLNALLKGEAGQSFLFDNDEQANEFVDALEQSAIDTINPLKNPLIALSPGAGIVNGISGLFGGPHIGGSDFELPPAEETYVEVGPEVNVKGGIGAGGGYVNGSVTGSGVVGAKINHRTGDRTIYIKVAGTGQGDAGVVFGPGAQGGLEGTGLVAVTIDKHGNATNLRFQGEGAYRGGFNTAGGLENFDSIRKGLGAGGSAADQDGMKYQLTADLDLTDPANAQAASDLLTSIGQGALFQGPAGVVNPDSVQATRNLFRRFDEAGRISFLTYDTSQQNLGFDVGGGEGIRFAVNGGLQFNQGALQDAYYRVPGVGFVPWPECGG
jgi:hypothetical protein